MRLASLLGAFALAAASHAACAQDASMRLEMLCERIAKLHSQVGQGVLPERSRKALAEAMREFDAGLREVKARPTGPEVRDNYLLLGLLWIEYRAWAGRPPSRDNAKKLAERAEEVAWVASKGARLLHETGRKGAGLQALVAAHAGTLSQRLARLYLARRWGVKEEAFERQIPAVAAELKRTLEELRGVTYNTPEIETELQAAEGQLGFLLQAGRELEGRQAAPRSLEFVAKSGDHLLESMQRVVRLYEGG